MEEAAGMWLRTRSLRLHSMSLLGSRCGKIFLCAAPCTFYASVTSMHTVENRKSNDGRKMITPAKKPSDGEQNGGKEAVVFTGRR